MLSGKALIVHSSIASLKVSGWDVETSRAKSFRFPRAMADRYGAPPPTLAKLLTGIRHCHAPDERSWFLCHDDYSGKSGTAFAWNEFETMSLDAAEGDAELITDVQQFWASNIPVYMSVRDGYSFAAICIRGRNYGRIVEGREPEFEEVRVVANDLKSFVDSRQLDGAR